MHYHVELFTARIPTEKDIEEALAPFCENGGEQSGEFAWDWYQVGGRWRGSHVPDYDPDKDESLQTTCDLCKGTGTRPGGLKRFGAEWVKANNGCNGCKGTGKRTEWPTQWPVHEKDTIPVSECPDDMTCYCFIADGKAYPAQVWTGEDFKNTAHKDKPVKTLLAELGILFGYLTTIDCHC